MPSDHEGPDLHERQLDLRPGYRVRLILPDGTVIATITTGEREPERQMVVSLAGGVRIERERIA